MSSIYDLVAKDIRGKDVRMDEFRGKTLLIVNTASECGFTYQYEGLENLYRKHKDRGLVVLGFPCDQFGHQEPGSEAEIAQFCTARFQVSFPMFSKVDVNGSNAHPLFQLLTREARGLLGTKAIKWNFTKFLVSPQGEILERYAPTQKPEELEAEIVRMLPASAS